MPHPDRWETSSMEQGSKESRLGPYRTREIVKEEKVKTGQEIEVSIMRRDVKNVMRLFGTAKTADKFERDHTEREV